MNDHVFSQNINLHTDEHMDKFRGKVSKSQLYSDFVIVSKNKSDLAGKFFFFL